MVTKQQIEFVIGPDGSVEFTIKGTKGRKCEDIARLFESLGTVEQAKNTGEYYERETDTQIVGRTRG